MTHSKKNQRGYSLLEALVAIAILAGISIVLAPTVQLSLRAAARVATDGDRLEKARVGEDALAEILSAVVDFGPHSETPAFAGSRKSIRLTVIEALDARPKAIELAIRDGALFYSLSSTLTGDAGRNTPSDVVLLSDVERFRFYGRANSETRPDWHDDWREERPPSLVEIIFRPRVSGRQALPLAVSIPASAPLHCAFDQVMKQCRS